MIMAELHGKLSEEASSIDTSEDVLTSNVFQCLRYLKPNDGIVPFLNAVFRDNGYKGAEDKLDRALEWEVDYYFWPVGKEKRAGCANLFEESSDKIYRSCGGKILLGAKRQRRFQRRIAETVRQPAF